MTNENIKEILNKLRSDDYYEKEYQKSVYYERDLKKLEDCITNLENEQISKYQTLKELQEENERLSVELNKNMIERNNYLSRNEKAREMIRFIVYNSERPLTITELNKVYNILGGDE